MKAKDLRRKSDEELNLELLALRKSQFGLRMQGATQQLSNTSEIARVRKSIARVKTIKTERVGVAK